MIAVVTSETLVTSSRGYLLVGDHAGNFSLLAVTSESADPLLLLQGQSVHSTLLEFASREGIDIMILGSKESKGTVQKLVAPGGMGSSTSDTMKSKSKCPCLIIRPAVSIIGCFLALSYSFLTDVRYQEVKVDTRTRMSWPSWQLCILTIGYWLWVVSSRRGMRKCASNRMSILELCWRQR